MPKSRKRGGEKAHRKRVSKRNELIRQEVKIISNLQRKIYEEAKARYEEEQSRATESEQTTFKLDMNKPVL